MNYHIIIKAVEKRTETDHYENGCDPDSTRRVNIEMPAGPFLSITDAFIQLVRDPAITAQDIGTIDPNIYQDRRDGTTRTVEDNTARGLYRATYQRTENRYGRKPSTAEEADFKAGKISLKLADYDLYFNIQLVDMDEVALAAFLGCNNF